MASVGDDGVVVMGVDSARHEAMKSWRTGFMRCRTREGPWGSHQELAREEKWLSSSGETEVVAVEWRRVVVVVVRVLRVRRVRRVGRSILLG